METSDRLLRPTLTTSVVSSARDLAVAGTVFGWITVVLLTDAHGSLLTQRLLGVATWALLLGLAARETPLVRAQIGVVVVFASAVEYTFSPLLHVYAYRFDNVPAYVPPGHGLIYLCALAFGRSALASRWRRPLVALVLALGGGWALHGVLASRPDALGAFWFCCLAGFLAFGRSRLVYVGAFWIVGYLELLGTHVGTWVWATHDPTGIVSIGNPPSGAAGGYGWFDLAALLLAPHLVRLAQRLPVGLRPGRRPLAGAPPAAVAAVDAPALPDAA